MLKAVQKYCRWSQDTCFTTKTGKDTVLWKCVHNWLDLGPVLKNYQPAKQTDKPSHLSLSAWQCWCIHQKLRGGRSTAARIRLWSDHTWQENGGKVRNRVQSSDLSWSKFGVTVRHTKIGRRCQRWWWICDVSLTNVSARVDVFKCSQHELMQRTLTGR